mmetsp:Transcript_68248/g.204498  ORF Transcript_68248/g.204498 Transcript_68248/m.204498 type:complete len:238 (-) Transcript_68248:1093-1806(-)
MPPAATVRRLASGSPADHAKRLADVPCLRPGAGHPSLRRMRAPGWRRGNGRADQLRAPPRRRRRELRLPARPRAARAGGAGVHAPPRAGAAALAHVAGAAGAAPADADVVRRADIGRHRVDGRLLRLARVGRGRRRRRDAAAARNAGDSDVTSSPSMSPPPLLLPGVASVGAGGWSGTCCRIRLGCRQLQVTGPCSLCLFVVQGCAPACRTRPPAGLVPTSPRRPPRRAAAPQPSTS